MSRNSSGTYTLPAGNPVIGGTVISTVWANGTLSDIATALTDSLSRSGAGGMLAPLELISGDASTPGLTFEDEPTLGIYRATTQTLAFAGGGAAMLTIAPDGIAWTTTGPLLVNTAAGTDGQVLTSKGPSAAPQWADAGHPVGANPSAQVGLSAVNGVATTFLRSDGAPALDQSIAPTWTGSHQFNLPVNFQSAQTAPPTAQNPPATYGAGASFSLNPAGFSSTGGHLVLQSRSNNSGELGVIVVVGEQGVSQKSVFGWRPGANWAGPDSQELRFGTGGDDLAIYHDGTNNYIDSNTGALNLRDSGGATKAQINTTGVRITALDTNSANVVRSGTYTPTVTNVANCASVGAQVDRYVRIGNVVTVSGHSTLDPTSAATLTRFRMSLPIASNLATGDQLSGVAIDTNTSDSTNSSYTISGDVTNDEAEFRCESISGTAARTLRFVFSYEVV